MKKVINSKLYNTETSTSVACWWNHYGRSDFNFEREELYRSPKGAWFIFGEGGARSPYAVQYGSVISSGEDIRPLTEKEALEWLCAKKFAEEAIEYFGAQIEQA